MRERIFTIVYMMVLCVVATAMLTGAKVALEGRIAQNDTLRERRATLQALGLLPADADADKVDAVFESRVRVLERQGRRLYLALDDKGETATAVGFEFEGMGFWGPIRGMMSLDPTGAEIKGVVFVDHQETPGLGGRMKEPWFEGQFAGKDVAERAPDGRYLVFVAEGMGTDGTHEVNAISGATRTSDSLDRILNGALKDFFDLMADEEMRSLWKNEGGVE